MTFGFEGKKIVAFRSLHFHHVIVIVAKRNNGRFLKHFLF
jgi:hypothetical protein